LAIDLSDVIFTVEEASEFARVTPAVIRRWFDEGLKHLPTVTKVGKTGPRREIIRKSALLTFIESRELGALVGSTNRPPERSRNTLAPIQADPRGLMTKKDRRGR
jgi:hypothetical protein